MFKRIRLIKGDTLNIELPMPDRFRRIVRAQITKGSGTPIARMNQSASEDGLMTFRVGADITGRMAGTYRYEIAVESDEGVKTVQHGILEVL
ncbi:MAG: hypothetical protein ACRC2Y_04490 [Aeromonas veronii]